MRGEEADVVMQRSPVVVAAKRTAIATRSIEEGTHHGR